MSPESTPEAGTSAGTFATTHWSVVMAAGPEATGHAENALERLCRTYWWPLYAFVRRRGYEAHEAEDLTQEFFARLLANDSLHQVDRRKGKFRSFLLSALEHFLANEWRRAHSQKRGGEFVLVSFETVSAEEQYLQVQAANLTPERVFEQQWALTLLDLILAQLKREFVNAAKGDLFDALKVFLTGEKVACRYAELASRLQTSEAALKMAVSRMRRRYGELVRAEIERTVCSSEEVEDELRALFAALS